MMECCGKSIFFLISVTHVFLSQKLNGKPFTVVGDGNQTRDFIYVDDIIEAYLCLLSIPAFSKGHEVFNIGTGKAVSIRHIGSRLSKILGGDIGWGKVAHRKNEVWHVCADIRKAKTFLTWRPRISILEEGLQRTIESYQDSKGRGNKK